jgi:hypothetical protein
MFLCFCMSIKIFTLKIKLKFFHRLDSSHLNKLRATGWHFSK